MLGQKAKPSGTLRQFLQVYRIELFGRLLLDQFHLPLPVILLLFVFLNFGVRLIVKSALDTPGPSNFGAIFRPAPGDPDLYYYPNLTAITNDLIGLPLVIALLVFFRSYIHDQIVQLEQNRVIKNIKSKSMESRIAKLLHFFNVEGQGQKLAIIGLPLAVGVLGFVADISVPTQPDVHEIYALFQSFLGRYARVAIFVQFVYVFLILSNCDLGFELHLSHPDGCSGLYPFGKLAIAGYIYLFVHAMLQALGTVGGGTGFERGLRSVVGSSALIYLWILFPLALILIFSQLVYRPHRELQRTQKQYLLDTSAAMTDYHQKLTSNIIQTVEKSEAPLTDKASFHFSDDVELLEKLSKLNKYVEDMHTWPLPKRTFRTLAVLANPLIPMLLSVVSDVMKNLLT